MYRLVSALVGVALLSACAPGLRPGDQGFSHIDWSQRQKILSSQSHWQVEGRVALQTRNDSWSAGLQWTQRDDDYEMILRGPLGGKALTILGQAGQVTLIDDKGKQYTAQSAEQLIFEQTGWRIPVDGLRYWVMAMQQPLFPADKGFRHRLLSKLQQAGWQIDYLDYQDVKGYPMPRKVDMRNQYLKVRLVLRQWQLPQLATIQRPVPAK